MDAATPDQPDDPQRDSTPGDDTAPPLSLDDITRMFTRPATPEPSAAQREAAARPFAYLLRVWQGNGLTEDQALRLLAYWLRAGEVRA